MAKLTLKSAAISASGEFEVVMEDLKFANSSIADGLLVEELENCSPPKPLES